MHHDETTKPSPGPHSPVVGMIWAEAHHGVVGHGGAMPWHVPEDMKHFQRTTRGCPVVMGRKTWDSLPERFRPLPGRVNIVITGDTGRASGIRAAGALVAKTLKDAVGLAGEHTAEANTIWIMGGGRIYTEAVETGIAQLAVVTQIDIEVAGDTYAPTLNPDEWELTSTEPEHGWETSTGGANYRITTFERV